MEGFIAFKNCLLCNSTELHPLKGYENNYLVRCRSCRFVFSSRKPSERELLDHYQNYPRGNAISPITVKRYEALLDKFEKFRKTGNLLDIGCGDGHFLEVAKKKNWKVYGTEFTTEAVRMGMEKGINMSEGKLDGTKYDSGFFDVITSFEVIEHMQEPQMELKGISKILRPGGVVYVTTPNFNSISRNIAGARWNIIEYPEHLSYYTRRTLKKLFSIYQFKPLGVSTTGISFNRLARSRGYSDTPVVSDEALRKEFERNYFLNLSKTLINFVLNVLGKGDSLKAFFLKS